MYFTRVLFLILLGIIFCGISFTQYENDVRNTEITLFGGLMLPQGDFSNTSGQNAGYAKTGFGAGLELNYQIDPIVYWSSGVTIAVNSVDVDLLAEQMQYLFPSNVSVSSGDYTTIWILSGINLKTKTPSGIGIYGLGQVGVLLSSFPDIEVSFSNSKIKQTTDMGVALGIGLGVGMQVGKFNFGIRYYTGEPKYKQKADYEGNITTETVKLPATLLSIMIGYNF